MLLLLVLQLLVVIVPILRIVAERKVLIMSTVVRLVVVPFVRLMSLKSSRPLARRGSLHPLVEPHRVQSLPTYQSQIQSKRPLIVVRIIVGLVVTMEPGFLAVGKVVVDAR